MARGWSCHSCPGSVGLGFVPRNSIPEQRGDAVEHPDMKHCTQCSRARSLLRSLVLGSSCVGWIQQSPDLGRESEELNPRYPGKAQSGHLVEAEGASGWDAVWDLKRSVAVDGQTNVCCDPTPRTSPSAPLAPCNTVICFSKS